MRRGGAPKQQIGFKAPEPMRRFIEERSRADNANLSDIVREAAELYKDLYEQLGSDWFEAKKRAGMTAQSFGSVLAALVRKALEGEPKNRK